MLAFDSEGSGCGRLPLLLQKVKKRSVGGNWQSVDLSGVVPVKGQWILQVGDFSQ